MRAASEEAQKERAAARELDVLRDLRAMVLRISERMPVCVASVSGVLLNQQDWVALVELARAAQRREGVPLDWGTP